MKVFKFIEWDIVSFEIPIKGINYEDLRFKLNEKGLFTLKPPFVWDGATPKFNFLDITWGTPDGCLNIFTGKPKTYYATMVHDLLYQSLAPITRKQADECFVFLAKRDDFKLWKIYNMANRIFGRFYQRWRK